MHRLLVSLVSLASALPAWANGDVPSYLIRLPASVDIAFVAETTANRFHCFDKAVGHGPRFAQRSNMSIGENGAGKQRAGDRKTPLGIYFITRQTSTEKLHEKYGATALLLDYPNAWDRRRHLAARRRPAQGQEAATGHSRLHRAAERRAHRAFEPFGAEHDTGDDCPAAALAEPAELESAVRRWAETLESGNIDGHHAVYSADF